MSISIIIKSPENIYVMCVFYSRSGVDAGLALTVFNCVSAAELGADLSC